MTTRNNMPKTAREAYASHTNDIARLLDCIQMELHRHAEEAKADPKNWGRAGDVGEVRRLLVETLAFISNREISDIEEFLNEAI